MVSRTTDYVPRWECTRSITGPLAKPTKMQELKFALSDGARKAQVLDVRPRTEYGICHLPGSISEWVTRTINSLPSLTSHRRIDVPIKELLADPLHWCGKAEGGVEGELYVVCRLGNDSQLAVAALRDGGMTGVVKDLVGGLRAWAREVDRNFPVY